MARADNISAAHPFSSPRVNATNAAWASGMPTVVKVNHLRFHSLSFCHLLYPTEHEEHLDLRAAQGWVRICLFGGEGLVFVSNHLKVYFRGDGSEGSKDGEHKVRPSERERERGPRSSRLLSQNPLKFDSPTLNKSTDHPSLPFFQVWGSYQRTPTITTLPLAPSFLSLARILTSFFFFPLLTQKRVGHHVIASIFMKSRRREWV